jgi:hypothetical protein
MPTSPDTITATFADDTAVLASSYIKDSVSEKIQNHLDSISDWCGRWKIKLNATKSQMCTFALRPGNCRPVLLNNEEIAQTDCVRYLGLHIDRRMTWSKHIRFKRQQLDQKFKQLYRLIGRKSKLAVRQKLTIYNYFLKPIWLYGSQIFGCSKSSNLALIQRFQNKTLRNIANCPTYVSNLTLHTDFKIPYVLATIKKLYKRFFDKLDYNDNPLVQDLFSNTLPHNPPRRLKRLWCRDLRL